MRYLSSGAMVLIWLIGCGKTTVNGRTSEELRHAPQVQHIVVCWLKQPGNAEARKKLIDASYDFRRSISGLTDVTAGAPLPSGRPNVDQSFDVAIVMSFKDVNALADYQSSPQHQNAVKEILRPLTSRVIIYDFVDGASSVKIDLESEQGRPTTNAGRP
jgi:hypothetical protein